MESVRRISHVITVEKPGAIVPLDFQLPTEATQCLGLQTTVTGLFPRVKSVVDFGEISISFNGKQNHSFHHLVSYENANARQASSIKCGLLPLSTVSSLACADAWTKKREKVENAKRTKRGNLPHYVPFLQEFIKSAHTIA